MCLIWLMGAKGNGDDFNVDDDNDYDDVMVFGGTVPAKYVVALDAIYGGAVAVDDGAAAAVANGDDDNDVDGQLVTNDDDYNAIHSDIYTHNCFSKSIQSFHRSPGFSKCERNVCAEILIHCGRPA